MTAKWEDRRVKRVIADVWAKMVSTQTSVAPAGREEIVDKFWIDPTGVLVHHGLGQTHQEYARDYLREKEGRRDSGNLNKDVLAAEETFLKRGWIRGQVYSFAGLGLQGSKRALKARGRVALEILPKPRRLYLMEWPTNTVTLHCTGGE